MRLYPLSAAITLALYAQGLCDPSELIKTRSTKDRIHAIVRELGCLQIDTLQMVRRTHYIVLWSRMGSFDPEDLDRLIYDEKDRRLFEGWQHEASIIPIEDYCFQFPYMRRMKDLPYYRNWQARPGNEKLVEEVLARIRKEGPLRSADFEYHGPRRGTWWGWKPAKNALEYLKAIGVLMVRERQNFQLVYDLRERVLPSWVSLEEPSTEEVERYWIEQGVKALGICTEANAAEYAHLKKGKAAPHLADFLKEGVLIKAPVRLIDKTRELILHRDNLSLLERAADGDLPESRTTFLSPFDNLFWGWGRDQLFWGFRNVLEAYKPEAKRIWGYFCLPILYSNRLVGRFDPKMDRKNGVLQIKALYMEPEVKLEEKMVGEIGKALRDFMRFHQATDVVIGKSEPQEFGKKLLKAISSARIDGISVQKNPGGSYRTRTCNRLIKSQMLYQLS